MSSPDCLVGALPVEEVDLAAFWHTHRNQKAVASLVAKEVADTRASGRVTFDATGAISSFSEKGQTTGPGWINAGIYLLSRTVLDGIPLDRAVSIERETLPSWVGHGLYAFPTAGNFLDIGTPETYVRAQATLL